MPGEDYFFEYPESPRKPRHTLEPPRRRSMNNDDRDDFVAIDFETMTSLRTSACSLGMVKVMDGEIVQQFYTLINPVRDEYIDKEPNRVIHGLSLEMVEKAATFEELFEGVRLFIGGYKIVCHNKGADIAILNALMEYYGLSGIDTGNVFCTYAATGKSLSQCCKDYGIPETAHHNALWDAEACAKVYLELIGKPLLSRGGVMPHTRGDFDSRRVSREHCARLDDSQVEDKSTVFYGASVVITGVFKDYPARDELAQKIQALGAKIVSSISRNTQVVVIGENAGPKKLDKIRELQDAGREIKIIREHQLAEIFG